MQPLSHANALLHHVPVLAHHVVEGPEHLPHHHGETQRVAPSEGLVQLFQVLCDLRAADGDQLVLAPQGLLPLR